MPRARVCLTAQQKNQLRAHHAANPDLTQQQLSDWTYIKWGRRVERSTVSKIINSAPDNSSNPDSKRKQAGRHAAMEDRLFDWFLSVQERASISDTLIWAKANDLLRAEPSEHTVSLSWVSRFKVRHGIKLHQLHGEAGSVDVSTLEDQRKSLRELLREYSPSDVFNMDETGLFFRMQPSQTLATRALPGRKKDKARITVVLCANMAGTEKISPLVINQHQNPRCMKGVDRTQLGVRFLANKKAWMTSKLFSDWLKSFNLSMCGRKVLLLVDNAPCHVALELSNVRLHFLPPNTTSHLQPMDAGVIKNFKLRYRCEFVQWSLDQLERGDSAKKMDVLTAVRNIVTAWDAVTPDTIRNCWLHTGIIDAATAATLRQENEPKRVFATSHLDALIQKLSLDDPLPADAYIAYDADVEEWVKDNEMEVDSSSSDEDEINQPLTHREALALCEQLATYTFAHGIESRDVLVIAKQSRKQLLGSLRQTSITNYFEQ